MNYLSLFSGIGGLDLGFDRAGLTCVGQVENNPFCLGILKKHWPEVDRHDEIHTTVEWWHTQPRPPVDVVVGGFPCQPASNAGKRLGNEDVRWLWPQTCVVIRQLRPRWVVLENVPGLLGRGLGEVLGDLAEIGYDAEWDCVPASAVGAPHRRDRVFIIAHPNGVEHEVRPPAHGRQAAAVVSVADSDGEQGGAVGDAVGGDGLPPLSRGGPSEPGGGGDVVADASGHGRGARRSRRPPREGAYGPAVPPEGLADPHGPRRGPWGWLGAPTWSPPVRSGGWTPKPRLGGTPDGLSVGVDRPDDDWERGVPRTRYKAPNGTDRVRALGNAVVPQVAEHVARILLAMEARAA